MFNVGDTVRISPISMFISPQAYKKFKDNTGTVVGVCFNKVLINFKDTTYYAYEWLYNIELKHSTKLTKSEKFILGHMDFKYCTSSVFDICAYIKFDNNYDDVIKFISECNICVPSFIVFNDYINDDIHNEIDRTRFSIKVNKNYIDVVQYSYIVFNPRTDKLNIYSEERFNKSFMLLNTEYSMQKVNKQYTMNVGYKDTEFTLYENGIRTTSSISKTLYNSDTQAELESRGYQQAFDITLYEQKYDKALEELKNARKYPLLKK